jgi:uncharacterized protein (TIGR02145 family)
MNKQKVNTFIKGMSKDVDKSVMSENSYLNADNFRIVTSEGSSSGALENIKGNKWLGLTSLLATGQLVCGSVRLRDYIVLFTTDNTTTTPSGGRSMLYKLVLDKVTETASSLTVLYDDSLNNSTGTLNFSTANKIKAVAKYETPNIQKVYWTDGYNNIRYADVAKNLTITGTIHVSLVSDYMPPEMLEFLPLFTSTKPTLLDIVGGNLMSGMVQYAYQLYRLNGAETAFSPVSDMFHIVSDNDFKTNTLNYRGDSESVETGKGCKISIVNANIGYDRLRLVRIHYSTLNSIPVINIATEIEISTSASTIIINDVGDNVSSLTLDEFNISSTELFKCEDIAIKDNRLFAANIEKDEFTVDDFDARAVRFRNYTDPTPAPVGTGTTAPHMFFNNNSTITYTPGGTSKTYQVTVTNFKTEMVSEIPSDRTIVTVVDNITTTRTTWDCIVGNWYDTYLVSHDFNAIGNDCSFHVVSYNAGTGELVFSVTSSGMDLWGSDWDYVDIGVTYDLIFDYTYTTPGTATLYQDAVVWHGASQLNIAKPTNPALAADWVTARWDTTPVTGTFQLDHDAINKFNDTDNDNDTSYGFKYQANCTTLGAEGPNVKIDFEIESVVLDNSNSDVTFNTTSTSVSSYTNFASPWMDGSLSWQRDETYRVAVVWENNRGQRSAPQWIVDLRMPSLHDVGYSSLASYAAGVVTTTILRPRIYFKSKPANAVSCQIYRIKREREDRSIITQALALPSKLTLTVHYPDLSDSVIPLTNGIELVKLVSPEVNITKNITKRNNDYIEYVTYFSTSCDTNDTPSFIHRHVHKLVENTRVAYSLNTRSDINDIVAVGPSAENTASYRVTLDGKLYCNYYEAIPLYSKGCSGLLVSYSNTSWSAENASYVLVNYRAKVFDSQYGGNTYEDRTLNIYTPCSGVITTINTWYSVKGGDTFINYFDVSTLLVDMVQPLFSACLTEAIYVPLESSINCDLRHDTSNQHVTASLPEAYLRQEYAGEHIFLDTFFPVTRTYKQEKDLYLYNTVYSQQTSVQNTISEMLDTSNETVFDCLVKASNVKYTGENADSWTNFNINEEIEVDSNYGEVRAIQTVNEKLLYWQEDAFGILSVNDRSLIQDTADAQLVLGTGGVLSRYDYISDTVGILDNHCIVNSDTSVYWFYDKDTSIYRFDNKLSNVTKDKGLWSWFKTNYSSLCFVHGVYDRAYNEVIYTLYKYDDTGYTVALNEQTDQFTSFYSFVPRMYIDYKDGCLSVMDHSGMLNAYGALYNWYAVSDVRNIANTGWHVPTSLDFHILRVYVHPAGSWNSNIAAPYLKENNPAHWTNNTGHTNAYNFNAVGSGGGDSPTGYYQINLRQYFWINESVVLQPSQAKLVILIGGDNMFYCGDGVNFYNGSKVSPKSVRLVKDSTTLIHGQIGTYTGNDGKVYNTICIGTQEWLSENLRETKYRDGTIIPEVVTNISWSSTITGIRCVYNNLYNDSRIFMHNSNVNPRCRFNSLLAYTDADVTNTYASTIKLLYNDNYPISKVFDNIFYISNAYDEDTDVDQYSTTFDQVRCYNDYQNSDWVDLVYPVNIMRRERGWTISVPRNLLEVDYTDSPDILYTANIGTDATKVWRERIRDKYMVLDLSFDNTSETRFVVPFIGIKYRLSYR